MLRFKIWKARRNAKLISRHATGIFTAGIFGGRIPRVEVGRYRNGRRLP